MIMICNKIGHRPRMNWFGVTWCTRCGLLFSGFKIQKPLDKNFTTHKSRVKFLKYN